MSRPHVSHLNQNLKPLEQSQKLQNVCYEIRGPVHAHAARLEAEGHRILKLNIGNPALFGFEAPDVIMRDMIHALPYSQGYSESSGVLSARRAVVTRYELIPDFPYFDVDDAILGNGVSELITMTMQALLNDGDEVLIPAPDYPLWTAAVALSGGKPVHYLCDEQAGWFPDLADMKAKISSNTKAIVLINPNNPTGAVYGSEFQLELIEIARQHNLIIFADEIYDKILYDDISHTSVCTQCDDVMVVTFNGLSKAYRACGFRQGWMVITGPKGRAKGYIEGLEMLASMRLCANVPMQHAIQTALGGYQSINELILPGGRLRRQRDKAWELLNEIPGVSCVKPKGALYMFPRLDPKVYDIRDDQKMVFDLLQQEKLLLVQGTGFNWPAPDHFRLVFLPREEELEEAIGRLARFLKGYKQ